MIQALMTELKFLSFDLILMILDSYYFGFNSQTMNIRMETPKEKIYIYIEFIKSPVYNCL